ncbi:hypothetical protein AGMMS49992_26800 [Clostridia bacterium]|nr:hypothetical protein AGMMS49992_26800 [Clostridia bacterium]
MIAVEFNSEFPLSDCCTHYFEEGTSIDTIQEVFERWIGEFRCSWTPVNAVIKHGELQGLHPENGGTVE